MLNILDVPSDKSSSKSSSSSSSSSSKHSRKQSSSSSSRRESRVVAIDIPKGRPLSVSQIKSPRPINPTATKFILEKEYDTLGPNTVAGITSRFANTSIDPDDSDSDISPPSSAGSSLSSRSGSSSPASSLSSYSTGSTCSCERYGITRSGDRIKLDCGGARCGYSDESCSSSSDDEYVPSSSRRQGIVVRR
jgi:hypothetical protein